MNAPRCNDRNGRTTFDSLRPYLEIQSHRGYFFHRQHPHRGYFFHFTTPIGGIFFGASAPNCPHRGYFFRSNCAPFGRCVSDNVSSSMRSRPSLRRTEGAMCKSWIRRAVRRTSITSTSLRPPRSVSDSLYVVPCCAYVMGANLTRMYVRRACACVFIYVRTFVVRRVRRWVYGMIPSSRQSTLSRWVRKDCTYVRPIYVRYTHDTYVRIKARTRHVKFAYTPITLVRRYVRIIHALRHDVHTSSTYVLLEEDEMDFTLSDTMGRIYQLHLEVEHTYVRKLLEELVHALRPRPYDVLLEEYVTLVRNPPRGGSCNVRT